MALTQTQVSQLYVSIFGRASEGEGNKYWATNGKDMASTANTMLATDAAKAYFGDSLKSNDAFIKHIYKNTLGKEPTDDAAGIKFWVDMLASGKSRGEVVATMIWAAQQESNKGVAQDMFNNKVKVSDYVAKNIEKAGSDLAVFKDFIAKVTNEEATLKSATAKVDVIKDNAALPSALATLDKANKAKADYLKTLPAIDVNVDGTVGSGEPAAGKATETHVNNFMTNAVNKIDDKVNDAGNFGGRSVEAQNLLISDALKGLEKAVADAAKEAKATSALIEAANAKADAVKKATEAQTKADDVLKAEGAKLATYSKNATLRDNSGELDIDGTVNNHNFGINSSTPNEFIMMDNATKKVLAEKVGNAWKLTVEGKELVGVLDFLKFYDAKMAADEAVETAEKALKGAVEAIVLAETGAHSVKTLGSVYGGTGATFNLSAGDAKVFKTAADAGATPTKAKYTFNLDGANTGTGGSAKIFIGGVEVSGYASTDSQDDTALAGALNGKTVTISGVTYDISNSAKVITLTAQTEADVSAPLTLVVKNNNLQTGNSIAQPSNPDATQTVVGVGHKEVPAVLTKVVALDAAVKALAEFKTDKQNFETARSYEAEVKKLNAEIKKAEDAISNKTDDKDAPGLGLNLMKYGTDDTATTKNDVLLFNGKAGATINNFGDAGVDRLYFGDKYKFVKLGDDGDPVDKATGDVATLEIFYKQVGGAVKLYVEKNAFSGQANGNEEYHVIELTTIGIEELTVANGFVSAGTVA